MIKNTYNKKYAEFGDELSQIIYQMMRIEYDKSLAKSNKPFEDSYYGKDKNTNCYDYYMFTKETEEYQLGLKYTEILLQNADKLSFTYINDFPDVAGTSARLLLNEWGIIYPYAVSLGEIPAKIEELTKKESVDSSTAGRLKLAYKYLCDCLELDSKYKNQKAAKKKHTK